MYITVRFIQIKSDSSTLTRSPSSRMSNLVIKQVLQIQLEYYIKIKWRNKKKVIPTAFHNVCKYVVLSVCKY